MEKSFEKYFLAANSCEGFCEHFSDSYNYLDGWRAYIIKGGPGTGKSSLMKYVAKKAADRGYKVSLCVCSSDPLSLDGVIIEDIKTVVLDGTAPHIVEPRNPGICEEILNLGEFWDSDILRHNHKRIYEISALNKSYHKLASKYLFSAGELIKDNWKIAREYTDKSKVERYAAGLCKKYIPKGNEKGKEAVRFIGGITPMGVVSYLNTLAKNYKNTVIIEDKYGASSGILMEKIREYAIKKGHSIITLKNPFLPSLLTDHILIPELSLMFATENEYNHIDSDKRRIHARRFSNTALKKQYKSRMRFSDEISHQLLSGAAVALNDAKREHDLLEKYYIKSMDFKSLTDYAMAVADKILEK
ncbi:MAG: hypothetical protein IJN15_02465 [Clostridia bacterium]|nr:hypothetical protein [Clostridia bacterium]